MKRLHVQIYPSLLKLIAGIACALLFIGCTPRDGYPDDWQPLATTAADQCPDIAGTFTIGDRIVYQMLGGHYEKTPRTWSVMSIAGNPQEGLQITLYEINTGAPYEQPIKRNRNHDYQCQDGWLDLAWPGNIRMYDENDRIPDDDLMEKSLSLAKNRAGELVIRTNVSHWKGIAVWCGDGCKYIPIPFTRQTYYTWSRWEVTAIPIYRPVNANAAAFDIDANAPMDETPAGRVARLLHDLAPMGVRVLAVKTDGNQWTARFRGTTDNLIALHEALLNSAAINEITDLQAGDRSSGERNIEITFRVSADKTTRDAKAAAEQARIAHAQSVRAGEERLVKLLLPNFPKDMVLTFFTTTPEGFIAEVRHKDEEAFYQLLVNAKASGNFSNAQIKNHKTVDGYGRQVVDVLLIPQP